MQPDSSTKPDQVAEAGRLEGKPKSSLQLCQNQKENKIKKSKLACWFNYAGSIVSHLHTALTACIFWNIFCNTP